MLHPNLLSGDTKHQPSLTAPDVPAEADTQAADHGRLRMISAVTGNVLMGMVFLASLLLMPMWLDGLLRLF